MRFKQQARALKNNEWKKIYMQIQPIAHLENDFPEKFGLPRQSGLAGHLISKIIMEEPYRVRDAFRGIEEFSHLWLLWEFDPLTDQSGESLSWSPTVRPPKLGGNERKGVFATRSPNRPNRIGLTLVKLIRIVQNPSDGLVLIVAGADMKSGTKIYDIKPYLEYADHPEKASSGFAEDLSEQRMKVCFECIIPEALAEEDRTMLEEVLSLDPRPGYQQDPTRVYGMSFRNYQVRFRVDQEMVHVLGIEEQNS